jgi:hypothetical protein
VKGKTTFNCGGIHKLAEERENVDIEENHTDQSIDTSTHSDINEEEIEKEYFSESDENED